MRTMRRIELAFALFWLSVPVLTTAQVQAVKAPETNAAAVPSYDISVIRSGASENGDTHIYTRLNTLEVRNTSIPHLLQSAFGVPLGMIVGLPEWARKARLDIDAKTLEPDTTRLRDLTPAQRQAMLQALFEGRMGLKWHYETRVLSTYDLIVASGGPKLPATQAKGGNGGTSVNDTKLRATNVPVSGLAVVLADKLGRPVVDKTGLTGRYDIALVWAAEDAPASGDANAPPPLFTAVQEQLGLKLESGKDPVQVFVVDQLTQPTPN